MVPVLKRDIGVDVADASSGGESSLDVMNLKRWCAAETPTVRGHPLHADSSEGLGYLLRAARMPMHDAKLSRHRMVRKGTRRVYRTRDQQCGVETDVVFIHHVGIVPCDPYQTIRFVWNAARDRELAQLLPGFDRRMPDTEATVPAMPECEQVQL